MLNIRFARSKDETRTDNICRASTIRDILHQTCYICNVHDTLLLSFKTKNIFLFCQISNNTGFMIDRTII